MLFLRSLSAAGLILLFACHAVGQQPVLPANVIGKELSNNFDEDSFGAFNPLRNLGWDGLGNTVDAFDYSTSGPPPIDPDQVDALANSSDYLFPRVLNNTVALVMSFDQRNDIHFHTPAGTTGVWATPGQVSNNPFLDDVDALELWTGDVGQKDGLTTPAGDFDANHFSIGGDAIVPGPPAPPGSPATSVYLYQPVPDIATPYILYNDLRSAVAQFLGFEPNAVNVDVDAMLLNDRVQGDPIPGVTPPFTWDPSDQIIFSVRPAPGIGLDGGELFFWENGLPIQWLTHGGRVWDTANNVAALFNVNTEDINALEAIIGSGIVGDLNNDGFVGIADLNIVLGAWNQNVPPGNPVADANGDGFVGIADLNIVLGNWNAGTPPPVSAIPEPGLATLILVGLMALLRRHRVRT